ncbi:hypothetical protein FDUTEX481_04043 [Tolypothrix sp. PCC 7601]|nr:hypothetical protein FDUTEX481_04043 [Tolypothrix sp. PCC 7601]
MKLEINNYSSKEDSEKGNLERDVAKIRNVDRVGTAHPMPIENAAKYQIPLMG